MYGSDYESNFGLFFIISIIILMLLSTGCYTTDIKKPESYTCSEEQLVLVDREVRICRSTTYISKYLSRYCFSEAKATLCDPIIMRKL
jgi:hypothetical protein